MQRPPSARLPVTTTTEEIRSAGCSRCERLPEVPPRAGTLYLWFPLGHTRGKAAARLRDDGHTVTIYEQADCLGVRLQDDTRSGALMALTRTLTREELSGTRALLHGGDDAPAFADMGRMVSLTQLSAVDRSGWLLDLLREERFTSWYQPIVNAKDTTRIFAQEALLRGRAPDGTVIFPGAIFEAATSADLLFQVDLAARMSAIRNAAALPTEHCLFVNFTPAAIYDPAFCLQRTVAMVDELGIAHERVVFEVVESGQAQDPVHLRRVLDFYRERGFRVALDDVGAGFSQLNLLHELHPEFIKIDMGLVRGVHADPYRAVIVAKLLEIALQLGITTVAEGVETIEEYRWLRDHGADYMQGYAIARPAAVPATTTPRLD